MQRQHPSAAPVREKHPPQMGYRGSAVVFQVSHEMAAALVRSPGGAAGEKNPLGISVAKRHIFERRSADDGNLGDRANAGRGGPAIQTELAIGPNLIELVGEDRQSQVLEPVGLGMIDEIRNLGVDRHVNQLARGNVWDDDAWSGNGFQIGSVPDTRQMHRVRRRPPEAVPQVTGRCPHIQNIVLEIWSTTLAPAFAFCYLHGCCAREGRSG